MRSLFCFANIDFQRLRISFIPLSTLTTFECLRKCVIRAENVRFALIFDADLRDELIGETHA